LEAIQVKSELPVSDFKGKLITSLINRFTIDMAAGEKVVGSNGNFRRIITVNLVKRKPYILASLLDPRVKLKPFEGTLQ